MAHYHQLEVLRWHGHLPFEVAPTQSELVLCAAKQRDHAENNQTNENEANWRDEKNLQWGWVIKFHAPKSQGPNDKATKTKEDVLDQTPKDEVKNLIHG